MCWCLECLEFVDDCLCAVGVCEFLGCFLVWCLEGYCVVLGVYGEVGVVGGCWGFYCDVEVYWWLVVVVWAFLDCYGGGWGCEFLGDVVEDCVGYCGVGLF